MARRTRRRDLRLAGAVSPRRLGFSTSRARTLELLAVWERVAGPAIAARARPTALRRGRLEIEVTDPTWAEAIDDLLPRLLAGLDAALPGASVESGRLVVAGEDGPRGPRRAAAEPPPRPPSPADRGAGPGPAGGDERPVDESRLRGVMERYLERSNQNP